MEGYENCMATSSQFPRGLYSFMFPFSVPSLPIDIHLELLRLVCDMHELLFDVQNEAGQQKVTGGTREGKQIDKYTISHTYSIYLRTVSALPKYDRFFHTKNVKFCNLSAR